MLLGLDRRQWVFLAAALAVPLLANAAGIWHDVGGKDILQMLRGTYHYIPYETNSLDLDHNPWGEIIQNLLPDTVFLAGLAWSMIFISNQRLFQKQRNSAKMAEILTMSLVGGMVFASLAGFFMPFAWLPVFFNTLGVPVSLFMGRWSWVVLPITSPLLFAAMFISRPER